MSILGGKRSPKPRGEGGGGRCECLQKQRRLTVLGERNPLPHRAKDLNELTVMGGQTLPHFRGTSGKICRISARCMFEVYYPQTALPTSSPQEGGVRENLNDFDSTVRNYDKNNDGNYCLGTLTSPHGEGKDLSGFSTNTGRYLKN